MKWILGLAAAPEADCAAIRRASRPFRRRKSTGYAPPRMTTIDPIVVSVVLAAPPERAFAAFADQFGQWWPVATHSLSRHAKTRCRLDANWAGPGGAGARRRAASLGYGRGDRARPAASLHLAPRPEPDSAQWVDILSSRRKRNPCNADPWRLGSPRRNRADPSPRIRFRLGKRPRQNLRRLRQPES